MKGKFYAVGVGPGDPKLITIKAYEAINKCGAVALPKSMEKESTVLSIVKGYLKEDCKIIELKFVMKNDIQERRNARNIAAESICEFLDLGIDVCFVTLGDPSIYSTAMYIFDILFKKGYECEIIPGVPSFCAVASKLKLNIAEDNETFAVIPNGIDTEKAKTIIKNSDNIVLMKFNKNLDEIKKVLEDYNFNVMCVEKCCMDGEKIYTDFDKIEKEDIGYFTTAILKKIK